MDNNLEYFKIKRMPFETNIKDFFDTVFIKYVGLSILDGDTIYRTTELYYRYQKIQKIKKQKIKNIEELLNCKIEYWNPELNGSIIGENGYII